MKSKHTGRIEKKSSRTAGFTCLSRAASFKDKRECYSGPDNIAYMIIPVFFKVLLRLPWLFSLFRRFFFARGIYEYVIARTRYFDELFIKALQDGFEQIVIFGAGFDSRALRFDGLNSNTRIFELDAPTTQQDKLKVFVAKKLVMPQKLIFVPIDFNKESLEQKIARAGFTPGKKTLFLLEGVTMYLSGDAVEGSFRFISDASGTGSLVVFDHIHAGVLRRENRNYGEKAIYNTVTKVGEEWTFAFEEGEVASFLNRYDFILQDHSNKAKLENRYFRNSQGRIVGMVNGTHAIVTAIKK